MVAVAYIACVITPLYVLGGTKNHYNAQPLAITHNSFTLTNSVITANGQIAVANMEISDGSSTAHSVQFTLFNSNEIYANSSTAIKLNISTVLIEEAISPNGKSLYIIGSSSGSVGVINTVTNTDVSTISMGSNSDPDGLAFTPSGKEAYISAGCSVCTAVNVIDVDSGNVIHTIAGFKSPIAVAFQPSGKLAFVSNHRNASVEVVNVSTNTIVKSIHVTSGPYYLGVSPNGKLVYVPDNWSSVSVIYVPDNAVVNTIAVGSDPYSATFTPSGNEVYVTNHNNDTVSVIDVATNTVVNTIIIGNVATHNGVGYASQLSFSPTGTLAYVADHHNGNVVVVDVATNTVVYRLPVGSPRDVVFNSTGTVAYALNDGGEDPVHVINNLASTPFKLVPNATDSLALTIDAFSTNSIILKFGGSQQTINTGSNTIYGKWTIYSDAVDSSSGIYDESSALLMSNTLIIIPPGSKIT
jgi:YVTN family beta-propeller protein